MIRKPRLFLDTSALFTGIWSSEGGARVLLRMGEARAAHLFVSSQVLGELEDVIRRKAPQHLATLTILLDRAQTEIGQTAPLELVERSRKLAVHSGDAHILADAWFNRVDYLVTLDQAHFLNVPDLGNQIPFLIGTPGDSLAWLRRQLCSIPASKT
jgi:predicted nucleic acid-binding protein